MREYLGRISPNMDIIIMSRPNAIEMEYSEIKDRLEKLIIKSKIVNN